MKKLLSISIILIVLLAQSLFIFPIQRAQAFNYVTYSPSTQAGDCTSHDIAPQSYPSKWQTYQDPAFNTVIRRFTDCASDYGCTIPPPDTRPGIEYSTFSNGNSDGTKVVFGYDNQTRLFYDATNGNFLRSKWFGQLSYGDVEFRWSHSNPNVGYWRLYTTFYQYNYNTDSSVLLHDFKDWYPTALNIQNNDKGEQSWDSNDQYWAFAVQTPGHSGSDQAQYIMVYDKVNNTHVDIDLDAYYAARGFSGIPQPRWVTMSPSGKYVIAMFTNGGTTGEGHTAVFLRGSSSLTWARDLLNYQSGHPAWGYDIHGNEVFYFMGDGYLLMVPLESGIPGTISLFRIFSPASCPSCSLCDADTYWAYLSAGADYHFSTAYSAPGWVFITHAMNDNGTVNQCWTKREVYAVRASTNLSEVLVWRIAQTRGYEVGYNDQSRAQVSQDGKYIYYDSNWLGTQNREIFRAELPAAWQTDLSLNAPVDTTPPAAPTGVTVN